MMKKLLLFVTLIFISLSAHAAQDGVYGVISYGDVIGPSSISIANGVFNGSPYTNGNSNNNFNLANDGRFSVNGSVGYIKNNIGVELKYINLGSQHQTGVNGNSLQAGETGTYGGHYWGVNGQYFMPIMDNKHDIFFSLGAGQMHTTFATVNSQAFTTSAPQNATQNEWAALLGVGARFSITDHFGINLEADRITPVTHGLLNSGIYNNAYTILSVGFVVSY
jgi:outer membrane protein W